MLTPRRRALLGAFVAAASGVTVVALSTLLYASGQPAVPDRLAAAAVLVLSPAAGRADEFAESVPWSSARAAELVERLAAIDGVATAVPDRGFYAQLVLGGRPHTATVTGHGWASSGLGGVRLVTGRPPTRSGEIAVGSGLGLGAGSVVTLLTAAGPSTQTVTGVVDGPGIYLSDAVAAELAPGVRVIGVTVQPGADVRRVADMAANTTGARVLTGADRAAAEPRADARTRWIGMQVLTAMAALAGFVSVFVVASTFAFQVAQRRRELGLLRAIGATPRQVRRMIFGEALGVGAAASVTGVVLGTGLAFALAGVLVDAGFEPATFVVRFTAWPIALSLLLGPVVALAGAWAASRRAARVRPMEALREAVLESRPMGAARWIAGGLLTVAGTALAVGVATSDDAQEGGSLALYAAMALMTAAVALAPAFVPLVVRLLSWPLGRGRGATGMLVREGALSAPRRTAATAAPVLLTVAFAVLISGLVQTSAAAYAARRGAAVEAGSVIAPERGVPGLTDAAASAVPGSALLPTTVYADGKPIGALGVDPTALARLGVDLAELSGGTGAATASVAATLPSAVTFADGETVPVRVVAVLPDRSAPAGLLLPRATVRGHDPSALSSAILVDRPVAPPPGSGARLIDVAAYAAEADSAEDRLVWIFTLLLITVSAGYGAIAVANTLLMAAAHRVRDFRVLRLAGATNRQVIATVAAESALVVLIGTLLGAAVAVPALIAIRAGLSDQVGTPVGLVIPWPVVGGVVGLCLLLAVGASVLPARLALRRGTTVDGQIG
ncbi:putative ABC transport system permease protein [Allocatelliglobosispora scoriae]|uniref:Putative ABC transport system permease protein n=1 Tax=Allocatelliglobosispora scoriae TaxID=643052 RepID=A0A841BK05_9ACTN|nr:FtsX family ABC transporter permease [Allocatelliglobosispora scoriae]MBB5867150.1 putative ABC transport system permease protein [Allocatelliglobosispora scoriae]